MTMPRPKGKSLKIAEEVVPGLRAREDKSSPHKKKNKKEGLSDLEVLQTNNIENKEGLVLGQNKY